MESACLENAYGKVEKKNHKIYHVEGQDMDFYYEYFRLEEEGLFFTKLQTFQKVPISLFSKIYSYPFPKYLKILSNTFNRFDLT